MKLHQVSEFIKYAFTVGLLGMNLLTTSAQAQLIDTENVTRDTQSVQDRSYIQESQNREEVKNKLLELGVAPEQVQARVDALTDADVQRLAQDIGSLPAGGANDTVLILLLVIIIILLI